MHIRVILSRAKAPEYLSIFRCIVMLCDCQLWRRHKRQSDLKLSEGANLATVLHRDECDLSLDCWRLCSKSGSLTVSIQQDVSNRSLVIPQEASESSAAVILTRSHDERVCLRLGVGCHVSVKGR